MSAGILVVVASSAWIGPAEAPITVDILARPLRAILRHLVSENLDVVRCILACWERGELMPEHWSRWADPEIEFVTVGGPEPSSHTGLAEAAPRIEAFLDLWEDYRVEADEYRELDGERVLVLTRQEGRGKGSGVKIQQLRASLFHVRGGKVTRRVNYWDRGRALDDLGLEN
jgi:ketosteroid isomerase-like protein